LLRRFAAFVQFGRSSATCGRRETRKTGGGGDTRKNRDNRRREDRETVTAIAEGVEETRKEIIEPEIPETDMPVGTGTAVFPSAAVIAVSAPFGAFAAFAGKFRREIGNHDFLEHCGTPCVQHRVRRCFKVKHMRSIQATGKSVDAAIFSGLQQLGLSIDEVTINVIQHGTKGLLGIGAICVLICFHTGGRERRRHNVLLCPIKSEVCCGGSLLSCNSDGVRQPAEVRNERCGTQFRRRNRAPIK